MTKKWIYCLGAFCLTATIQAPSSLNALDGSSSMTEQKKVETAAKYWTEITEFTIKGGSDYYKTTKADLDRQTVLTKKWNALYPDASKRPFGQIYELVIPNIEKDRKPYRKYFKTQESEDKDFDFMLNGMKAVVQLYKGDETGAAKYEKAAYDVTPGTSKPKHNTAEETESTEAATPEAPAETPTPKPDVLQKTLNNAAGDTAKKLLGF